MQDQRFFVVEREFQSLLAGDPVGEHYDEVLSPLRIAACIVKSCSLELSALEFQNNVRVCFRKQIHFRHVVGTVDCDFDERVAR